MRLYCFIILLPFFCGCGYFDATDETPMFLEIENVDFQTDPEEGVNTFRFQGVAVYADGFNIGVFPIPASVPVLDLNDDGISEISIFPVIRNNGFGDNPIQYPFIEAEKFSFTFEEEKVIPIDLNFKYSESTEFVIIEDFEGIPILGNSIDNIPETEFVKSDETPYGNYCGKVSTTEEFPVFEETTLTAYSRGAVAGSPVFLEMDYRNDMEFKVGVIKYSSGFGQRAYKIALKESENWNKIYIELTDLLGGSNYEEFQLVFGSFSAMDLGTVYIDNIKLVVLR